MAGLTYGVPMLCFPMGRDQPLIAARVSELGVGSAVFQDAPTEEIQRAVAASLGDHAMKKRAGEFARSLAGHPGLDEAVAMIERPLPDRS